MTEANEPSAMAPTIIIGAGGHGREVLGVVRALGLEFGGFLDDSLPDPELLGRIEAVHLGDTSFVESSSESSKYLIGIGSGAARSQMALRIPNSRVAPAIVHPGAYLDSDIRLSAGVVIFANATVTTNIEIGTHSHIGRGAAIGHDCKIGSFVTVMPLAAVSGSVVIQDGATVGSGAIIRQGQTIGRGAFVGAGSVVVDDVPDGVTVVGNPARPL